MSKIRYIVIGSGWRAMFYARIAAALPEDFELCALYCRSREKADKVFKETGAHTTTSIEECIACKPDFAVIAVSKGDIFKVAEEWLDRGIPVLCETPLGSSVDEIRHIWQLHKDGALIQTAEQYHLYPTYSAMLALLGENIMGEPYNITLSAIHDYHGVSIIRKVLRINQEPFKIYGREHIFPVVETMSRYEKFYDGRTADKGRTRLTLDYGKKCGFYDFCSVQYRSFIRDRYINIQGVKGECTNRTYIYLDRDFLPHRDSLEITEENGGVSSICFKGRELYKNEFSALMPEDETAIAKMLMGMKKYIKTGEEIYSVKDALTDSFTALKMIEAAESGLEIWADPSEIFS